MFVELLQEEHEEQCGGAQQQIVGSCGHNMMHNSFKTAFVVLEIEKVFRALINCFTEHLHGGKIV